MSTESPESPHMAVAAEVRAALARQRISGRGAARELGWKSDYLWRRLDGRTPFDVNDLVAVAALLDVPVTDFFPDVLLEGAVSGGPISHIIGPTGILTWAYPQGARPELADLHPAA